MSILDKVAHCNLYPRGTFCNIYLIYIRIVPLYICYSNQDRFIFNEWYKEAVCM